MGARSTPFRQTVTTNRLASFTILKAFAKGGVLNRLIGVTDLRRDVCFEMMLFSVSLGSLRPLNPVALVICTHFAVARGWFPRALTHTHTIQTLSRVLGPEGPTRCASRSYGLCGTQATTQTRD